MISPQAIRPLRMVQSRHPAHQSSMIVARGWGGTDRGGIAEPGGIESAVTRQQAFIRAHSDSGTVCAVEREIDYHNIQKLNNFSLKLKAPSANPAG